MSKQFDHNEPTLCSVQVTTGDQRVPSPVVPSVGSVAGREGDPAQSQRLRRHSSGGFLGESERFDEIDLIGTGGMGLVVRAFDTDLHREVAIKVLAPQWLTDAAEVERFCAEARITGQLEHPYIIPVYEFGTDSRGARFLCMKLVHGRTLEDTLHELGPARLSADHLADLLDVFVKVCDAVAYAHSRGIIHRDLKPSNIMLGDFGQVYVADWGVARPAAHSGSAWTPKNMALTDGEPSAEAPGSLVGTLCYMAPEQLSGRIDQLDERTDVFGLGAMLYQILAGRPPRESSEIAGIIARGGAGEITPPERVVPGAVLPAELSRIALKAMSSASTDRYPSVNELKADVERFQRGTWRLPRAQFSAGTLIIREGDPGTEAHIIVRGICVAFCGDGPSETVLREMGPGDVYGETAVFSNKPRTASVRAATEVEVMVVTSDLLSNALGLNQWMGRFVKALADRFREVDEKLRHPNQR
ncbi:MAG: protein kinase [Polyangiaceae bacterium]|nr:protein kinase [Polyangiaceae bacterium]